MLSSSPCRAGADVMIELPALQAVVADLTRLQDSNEN